MRGNEDLAHDIAVRVGEAAVLCRMWQWETWDLEGVFEPGGHGPVTFRKLRDQVYDVSFRELVDHDLGGVSDMAAALVALFATEIFNGEELTWLERFLAGNLHVVDEWGVRLDGALGYPFDRIAGYAAASGVEARWLL